MTITGNIVDIFNRSIYYGSVRTENGLIQNIEQFSSSPKDGLPFILPGFIDAHVHIESSMLVPSEFARLAVVHGTVATVSDPHEIANVCGMEGVEFMIENGKSVPFKFHFGAPSCVPATVFETAGATINSGQVAQLLERDDIFYLSEMMNFPGVLYGDEEVLKKIAAAKHTGKPVDGHAPGLRGEQARKYISAGISTDHECFTRDEALDKLNAGMKIIVREGSAAKNFEELIDLLHDHPDAMMFCSDDKHPDSLVEGHINKLCQRALQKGINLFNILKAACVNPVLHYKLPVGLLRKGDAADFIAVESLENFNVLQTWINGQLVAENGKSLILGKTVTAINNFSCSPKKAEDFQYPAQTGISEVDVIEAYDGQLITGWKKYPLKASNGFLITDTAADILKIAVVNRYRDAPVAIAFIKNFGLKEGAIASSVAHDSHNIVVVGVDDKSIAQAVNLVIEQQGGISCVSSTESQILALPVAGLMSTDNGYDVAAAYTSISNKAKKLGSILSAPFMTLSFMALLVIPRLKLSDKGLFDGETFTFVQEKR
ncbi:adenine deaminase [Pedobacter sp. BS3]|uniref:adenine deaminase n=1 Tax=Pedobacter sp. BS3 TaxID=2567937 RepID=UPI0011EBEAAE|nr:adenine deaminase [Pedobacter sp. BS3]TZF81199.1 adenine deaminase [Pedobacter sp. BS3]